MASTSIETARLRLDRWSEPHTPLLVQLSSVPSVVRYIGLGMPWPQSKAEEISAAQRGHWNEHEFGWRAAVEKTSARHVGLMALNFVGPGTAGLDPSEYEIGWWLEPSIWGRGFAREGGEALCAEAFDSLAAPSVVARIQPENARSICVAEALGFALDFETTDEVGEPIGVYRLMAAERPRPPG